MGAKPWNISLLTVSQICNVQHPYSVLTVLSKMPAPIVAGIFLPKSPEINIEIISYLWVLLFPTSEILKSTSSDVISGVGVDDDGCAVLATNGASVDVDDCAVDSCAVLVTNGAGVVVTV